MQKKVCDFLVLGAGVMGLAVARQLLITNPTAKVLVVEKETTSGLHASGRNSGVLHSGFYYSPESLKAQLTLEGNRLLKEFIKEKGLPIHDLGKVVVAKSEDELDQLRELHRRGVANGVDVELVDKATLAKIEPLATTFELALWSPTTSVANPLAVVRALEEDFKARGGEIVFDAEISSITASSATSTDFMFEFGHLVNCAGMYADRIAQQLEVGTKYTVIPFIGLYRYAPSLSGQYSRLIYPVPDLRNPFLGVHLTVTVEDEVKIGPTSIPVVGREQYRLFEGLSGRDALDWLSNFPRFLFSRHHDVPSLIRTELPKISSAHIERKAQQLIPSIPSGAFTKWGKPGIRAQLFDKSTNQLVMDYIVEERDSSTHILNAVSPGWTTSLSFAKNVVDRITERIKSA